MGSNFKIIDPQLDMERFKSIVTDTVPEAITNVENDFSCKEAEFRVENGAIVGGDFDAMKIFNEKFANREESSVADESVSVAVNSEPIGTFTEVDPTCCQ